MSAKDEKKKEDAIKSSHKREKKRKSLEAFENGTSSGGVGANQVEDHGKAQSKLERKEAKRRKKEEAAKATILTEDDDEKKRKEKKAAKKKAKEERKAAKLADTVQTASESNSSAQTKASPTDAAAARDYMKSNRITIEAPEESKDTPPLPMLSFSELQGRLDDRLYKELLRNKFEKPTPIQACCWSVLLAGKDVVGIAETGSGKTMAFGLPAMQHILAQDSQRQTKSSAPVSVLVVAPTRELAIQTQTTMEKLALSIDCSSICLYGGVSKQDQIKQLRSMKRPVRAVVGTPGRLLDLAREGSLDLSQVSYAILDEADRMLDVGFEPDIRAILSMTKSKDQGRHTSMFSATWPMNLRGLAETFMKEPMRVTIGSDELSANHRVEQSVEVLDDGRAKQGRLEKFLRDIGAGPRGHSPKDKVIIFALYKKEAQRVEDNLRRRGYKVAGIHGDLSQAQRIASLDAFKAGDSPLLVATDVAARGIDVPLVEYVVNYTFPLTIEDYVHRIGRTGRAGRTGKSIT